LIQQHTVWRIYLDTDEKASIEDLEKYIEHQFNDIMNKINRKRRSSRLTPLNSTCLGETHIMDLLKLASGLFIWAKTATVFIYERLENDSSAQNIERIFTLLKAGHHKTVRYKSKSIDELYLLILNDVYAGVTTEGRDLLAFHRIMRALIDFPQLEIIWPRPLTLGELRNLLHERIASDAEENPVITLVCRLRSIIAPDAITIEESTIPRIHKSFFDFIQDKVRNDTIFYVAPTTSTVRQVQNIQKVKSSSISGLYFKLMTCFREPGSPELA